MFSEPQNLTVNAATVALPRVSFGDRTGTFEKLSAGLRLRFAHVLGKARTRRTVRLDFEKTAADPLLDGVSKPYSMTASLLIDHPIVGYSTVETEANAKVLVDWLAAPGNLSKVINGES